MKTLHALLSVLALSVVVPACAAEEQATADESQSEDELRALKITEADAGKTIAVQAGQGFSIALAANPTTGFDWKVVSTDRTLGYPYRQSFFNGSSGPVGSGGETRMYWRTTAGPLSMVGKHQIEVGYLRSFESGPPARKLTFTIDVQSAAAPPLPSTTVTVSGASGQTVPVKVGQDIVVKLAGPMASPLTGWHVTATSRTLGYPAEAYEQGEGAIGDSGHSTFTWKTANRPLAVTGSHRVVFEIDRGHGDGTSTFDVTFDITE